jgi:hypothetical protein
VAARSVELWDSGRYTAGLQQEGPWVTKFFFFANIYESTCDEFRLSERLCRMYFLFGHATSGPLSIVTTSRHHPSIAHSLTLFYFYSIAPDAWIQSQRRLFELVYMVMVD